MGQTINCFGNEIYQELNMREKANQPITSSVLFPAGVAAWQHTSQPPIRMLAIEPLYHVVTCPVYWSLWSLHYNIVPNENKRQMMLFKGLFLWDVNWSLEGFSRWAGSKATSGGSLQVLIWFLSAVISWNVSHRSYLQWHQENLDLCCSALFSLGVR